MRVFEVHLEDVWVIKAEVMNKKREQAKLALKHFEKTECFDKARLVISGILQKLDQVKARQEIIWISHYQVRL